jgi:hypothetical protein
VRADGAPSGVRLAALSKLFEDGFGEDAPDSPFAALPPMGHESDEVFDATTVTTSLLDDAPQALPVDEQPKKAPPQESEDGGSKLIYEIPDFAQDERDLNAYEDAKKRYLRQQISTAETAIQTSFKAKREQLTAEVKAGRLFEDERRSAAVQTTRQYANLYPQHVDKKGVNPPTLFENIFSFGRAGRLYRAAFLATAALEELRARMRRADEQLASLEGQMNRAIYLKEEAIKKAFETDAGIAEFHDRPEIAELFKRKKRIEKERAEWEARLAAGGVTDEEQRDRAMGEFRLSYAAPPLSGVIIAKVARFGRLSYFQLRDLTRKEFLLSYDTRLDPLRNSVFDVYLIAGEITVKLRRNENGTAYRVADHFKACMRNAEEAEELYNQHRSALRADRGLPTMEPRDEAEAALIEKLVAFAIMVEGGRVSEAQTAASSPASSPRS